MADWVLIDYKCEESRKKAISSRLSSNTCPLCARPFRDVIVDACEVLKETANLRGFE